MDRRGKAKTGDSPTALEDEILVDARGYRCPIPTLRLRRALAAAPPGARLRLLSDDPMARIDVPHFAAEIMAEIIETDGEGPTFSFVLRKPEA